MRCIGSILFVFCYLALGDELVGSEALENVFFKKIALENSFSIGMKFKMLVEMKEGKGLSPHAAPALSNDDVAPGRELSHRGIHSGGGETPF
jgi:hypothetical protein